MHRPTVTRPHSRPAVRRKRLPVVLGVLLVGACIAAPVVMAQVGRSSRTDAQDNESLTLEQAVAKVQRETGGKVLGADTQRRGRATEYRIKVLTPKGHVKVVPVRSDETKTEKSKEKR